MIFFEIVNRVRDISGCLVAALVTADGGTDEVMLGSRRYLIIAKLNPSQQANPQLGAEIIKLILGRPPPTTHPILVLFKVLQIFSLLS